MKATVRVLGLELVSVELTTDDPPNLAPDFTATAVPVGFTGPDQGVPYA